MLENLSGNFRVDKVGLVLDSPGGAVAHTGPGQTVTLGAVSYTHLDVHKRQSWRCRARSACCTNAWRRWGR